VRHRTAHVCGGPRPQLLTFLSRGDLEPPLKD
jgi:hypothetical protein